MEGKKKGELKMGNGMWREIDATTNLRCLKERLNLQSNKMSKMFLVI